MNKPKPKPTPKPASGFSAAEVKKFKAVKSGAEVANMKPAEGKRYMDWKAQRSTATTKRASKKKYGW